MMDALCTCLCRQAGHHGICQETPEHGLRVLSPQLTMTSTGEVCRPCYQATAARFTATGRRLPQPA
ncbi:hypothetical protein [Saccharopolyspora gloriosae]|uniref:hypothetical protein n=1 Tax=Saccharopolyspora gloriosae TaxID=455344 RepID=UPI001FB6B0D6|nr:hypothetical protein [Saccharopolyspora gloriosae]